jgi:hypothetical protein
MADYYLLPRAADTGIELTRFAAGYSLASAYVEDGVLYAVASRWATDSWNDVTLFCSTDLKNRRGDQRLGSGAGRVGRPHLP